MADSAYSMTPAQAFYFQRNRRRRKRRAAANGGGPGNPGGGDSIVPVSDFFGIYSRGSRGPNGTRNGNNTVVVTSNLTQQLVGWGEGLDGSYATNNGPYYFGHVPTGEYIQFAFPTAVVVDAFKMVGGDTVSLGLWQAQGSNDGATFAPIGDPFAYTIADGLVGERDGTTRGVLLEFVNTTPFKYYRIAYVSGTFNGGRMANEIEFRILHNPHDGNDRSAVVIVTANAAENNGRDPQKLVDGFFAKDNANVTPNDLRFNNLTALTFQFPVPVIMREAAINVANSPDIHSGLWQWSFSADGGATYTDSGALVGWGLDSVAPFVANATDSVFDGGNRTDKGTHWKLTYVSGARDNFSLTEVTFNLAG